MNQTDLDVNPETASDPDFWPRIVLIADDRLMLRGRNPEEVVRLAKVFEFIARSNGDTKLTHITGLVPG